MNGIKEHIQDLEKEVSRISTIGLANAGEIVYLENCDKLERKYRGQFAVIDPENRRVVEIGKTPVTALKKASEKFGQCQYYLRKIGEPTKMRI